MQRQIVLQKGLQVWRGMSEGQATLAPNVVCFTINVTFYWSSGPAQSLQFGLNYTGPDPDGIVEIKTP